MFRKGRQYKSGTGNNTRIPAARALVRPQDRRPLQELEDRGESLSTGAPLSVISMHVRMEPDHQSFT